MMVNKMLLRNILYIDDNNIIVQARCPSRRCGDPPYAVYDI